MKVEIGTRTYHARFKNASQRLVHQGGRVVPLTRHNKPLDLLPPDLLELLQAYDGGIDTPERWRRFLAVKTPQAVSVITTRCEIIDAASGVLAAWGESYYSQSELAAKRPFVKKAARHKSLRRALGEDIRHRFGQIWTERERAAFWDAFDALHLPRTIKIAVPVPVHTRPSEDLQS